MKNLLKWFMNLNRAHNVRILIFITALVVVYGLLFTACSPIFEGDTSRSAIWLTDDTWADGAISSTSTDQWFKFTATANTQYLHVFFGTLTSIRIHLYNSNVKEIGGDGFTLSKPYSAYTSYEPLTSLTIGREYYIKVTGYYSSSTGTFRIGINNMPVACGLLAGAVPLATGTWLDGVITSSSGEQWFKFTATAGMHYIHIYFGTLTDLRVWLYASNGGVLGNGTYLYKPYGGDISSTSLLVSIGQIYYVRVTPYSSSGSGTYRIALNTSDTAP